MCDGKAVCEPLRAALERVNNMEACPPFPPQNGGLLPHWGAVEVSDRVASINYFLRMPFSANNPKKSVLIHEFVWDPINLRFATILYGITMHGSPHESLAHALGADPAHVCGGIIRQSDGRSLSTTAMLKTNEFSGHFWEHWTEAIREQFAKYMRLRTGLQVEHWEGA